MKTQIVKPQNTNSKVIITGFFEDEKSLSNVQAELNKKFLGVIENNINKNFEGKFNETLIFPLENGVKIMALGLGKKEELTLNKLREAVSKAISGAKKYTKEGILSVEFIENDNICKKGAAYNTVIAASGVKGRYVGKLEYSYWSLAQPLRRIIASKVDKVNSGFYGNFRSFGLYVFCKDHLTEEEVNLTVSYTSGLQSGLTVTYSTLYLSLIDFLYVCDMKTGAVSRHEISRDLCRTFFIESVKPAAQ